MGKLDGKVAIVVGSATGIGAATAKQLANEGAKVVLADINVERAEANATAIRDDGGEAIACWVDIADESAIKALVAVAVERFGGVDVLHNNAAALGPDVIGPDTVNGIVDLDVAIWDRVMAVNLRGPALMIKHVLPHMIRKGRGSIINTSSVVSMAAEPVRPCYSISKAGVNGLTRAVATAYGKLGIRCNAIAPGRITNPDKPWRDQSEETRLRRHNSLPQTGAPDDIARTVAFLASDDSQFITGQIISVDGGYLSHMPDYAEYADVLAGSP